MVSGPIILIEDDEDDKNIIDVVLNELNIPNKTIWFDNCMAAFNYLKETNEQPFVIISDINLPGLSGVEFKQKLDSDERLRIKSIPFIFFSTSLAKKTVNEVYSQMNVQGYFQKASSYEQIKHTIKTILEYWKICKHPNSQESITA